MTKKVTVSGADLTFWHVAAANGLPPLAAVRIAQLTGDTDPWLTPGVTTLTLPDSAGPNTGGLPPPSPAQRIIEAAASAATSTATALGAATSGGGSGIGGGVTVSGMSDSLSAWFATLPTSMPTSAGQPWNNGGTLAFS